GNRWRWLQLRRHWLAAHVGIALCGSGRGCWGGVCSVGRRFGLGRQSIRGRGGCGIPFVLALLFCSLCRRGLLVAVFALGRLALEPLVHLFPLLLGFLFHHCDVLAESVFPLSHATPKR